MKTILKSFRLPVECIEYLKQKAKDEDVSESQVVAATIRKAMDFKAQWLESLQFMANDKEYRKEQLEMAEENYD